MRGGFRLMVVKWCLILMMWDLELEEEGKVPGRNEHGRKKKKFEGKDLWLGATPSPLIKLRVGGWLGKKREYKDLLKKKKIQQSATTTTTKSSEKLK
jgi:hypothetical protein